jgi:signal transduction histidine kinase
MARVTRKQALLKTANAGRGRKIKKLNKEALKIVDENAHKIAQSLYDSTLEGHVLSARLLVDLAEGDVEAEEALSKRPLRSLAEELAAEPQWKGEDEEAMAETCSEPREPVSDSN